jgi:purine-nucleoside phosphorylase
MSNLPPRTALEEAAKFVQSFATAKPRVGMVLGSGLMHLSTLLDARQSIPYAAIPHFPRSSVQGHEGMLHLGQLGNQSVVCLAGRSHGYEGNPPERVVFGVRLLARLGCEIVVLTNAAGAVVPTMAPGALMLITDHINLTGNNPLIGWYDASPRFVDMSNAYDPDLRALALTCASEVSVDLAQGVYAGLSGPSYETPAEVRMLAILGASAVGMSTVHETIALRDLGVRVLGISCITNVGAGLAGAVLDHAHVQAVARTAHERLENLVIRLMSRLAA